MYLIRCQEVPGKIVKQLLPQLDYFATLAESSSENSRCFNTDKQRPICLEAECDEAYNIVRVVAAGREFFCEFTGQKHLIPDTDVTIECPDIKLMCPE